LRTLLVLVVLASIGMSWLAVRMQRVRRQREAVAAIKKVGGCIQYDYESKGNWIRNPVLPGPIWARRLLGDDFFINVIWVNLCNTRITDAVMECVEGLGEIQELDLSSTRITDAGIEHLKRSTQLQYLFLADCKITDAGLRHLKGLTRLKLLSLDDTKVTDAGLEHLQGLTQLQELDLYGTQVTNEGIRRLQQALPDCEISH
jgi:Leucine-rich repeat (LRR) protein